MPCKLYPHVDRIVTADSVASLHPVYRSSVQLYKDETDRFLSEVGYLLHGIRRVTNGWDTMRYDTIRHDTVRNVRRAHRLLWHKEPDKKLSYRRGTARCVVSVEILPVATKQCRNYLYDKS